jgi:hypothetical protein
MYVHLYTVCTEKYTHSLPIYRLGVINQCLATKIYMQESCLFFSSLSILILSILSQRRVFVDKERGVYCLLLALIDPVYVSFLSQCVPVPQFIQLSLL